MNIFIINLHRSQDRKLAMDQQIAMLKTDSFPVEFHFFNAIDSKAGEHQQFAQYYNPFLTKIYRGVDLTDGEKACYASHFCLWQKCISLNEPIIIMEDDVQFSAEFIPGIKAIANSHYDYVKLIITRKNLKKPVIRLSDHFYTTWEATAGTQGYYITPAIAAKFIHAVTYWLLPVDDYMDRVCIHGVKTIFYTPPLLQNNLEIEESTINAASNRPPMPIFWKIVREVSRLLRQLSMLWYIMRNR